MCLSDPRSLRSGAGGVSEVQGRRRSLRRCWRQWQEHLTWAPAATPSRHLGLPASFEAHVAARPRARANCSAFGRTQGTPAWPRGDGGPPARKKLSCLSVSHGARVAPIAVLLDAFCVVSQQHIFGDTDTFPFSPSLSLVDPALGRRCHVL